MDRAGLLAAAVVLFAAEADAGPAQVILIRHAEKPAGGPDLSATGRRRAAALVPFFLEPPGGAFATPAAVYAQKSTKDNPSRRPADTVRGVAKAVGVELREFAHEDVAKMAAAIKAAPGCDGKAVLICWQHGALTDVAREFGLNPAPQWPPAAFDRVWVLTLKNGTPTFRDLPQRLLFGDSAK